MLSSAVPHRGHAVLGRVVLVPRQGLGCLELGSQCFPHSWPVQDSRGRGWRVGVAKKKEEIKKRTYSGTEMCFDFA